MSADASVTARTAPRLRLRLDVTGAVQGVGFRPFVHRLAVSEGLGGFVRNTGEGASVEIEGHEHALERFLARLDTEIAPPALIQERQSRRLPAQGDQEFVIAASACIGTRSALVLPDLASCAECLREFSDPDDRRYRYPFTTCVHCGPRYSIIETVPYDRAHTAMSQFIMCPLCQAEYDDPGSRRFHAETNACPDCGPQIALWDRAGNIVATRHQGLTAAADMLRRGRILALKGLGGFQLLVDARNEESVRHLRERKRRPAKPFAVMVPSLADALTVVETSAEEARLLCSAAAPIVLLRTRANATQIAASVAPANRRLGLMLPYTPLHHLLMDELKFPIVATSGNQGDEPIVAGEDEALTRLAGLADGFLVHDRPILRPVDDSVVQVVMGRETVLRCARGYAPLSLTHPAATTVALALGGHQKSSVALAVRKHIILGPHIGNLGGTEARAAFARAVEATARLYDASPQLLACDKHPDYHSTHFAERLALPLRRVRHHLAHTLAGVVDNGLEGPVLGVAWDGSGYGGDGSVWGGEFLAIDATSYRRVGHLLPFRLPGGEVAAREPRRAALGALYATFGESALAMTDLCPIAAFTPTERQVLASMLKRHVNSPLTSSAGRLFDAIAAILGLRQSASFEGEAAMALESAADRAANTAVLAPPIVSDEAEKFVVDWRPMLESLIIASRLDTPTEDLATAFHEVLAEAIVAVAMRVKIEQVLLTGGCFQNARLTARSVLQLREAGFSPYWHHRIPPNDGGIAVGQAAFAVRPLIEEKC
jgi:hydrogenase maturation protein HypF